MGVEHPLVTDGQCGNTLFHAEAERLSEVVPGLRRLGVRHFRVELLVQRTREEVRRVVAALNGFEKVS
jgi:U32 family peptidase